MHVEGVLRWRAIWILRTTPEGLGESHHGEIQEGFPRVAGSASRQRAARRRGVPGAPGVWWLRTRDLRAQGDDLTGAADPRLPHAQFR